MTVRALSIFISFVWNSSFIHSITANEDIYKLLTQYTQTVQDAHNQIIANATDIITSNAISQFHLALKTLLDTSFIDEATEKDLMSSEQAQKIRFLGSLKRNDHELPMFQEFIGSTQFDNKNLTPHLKYSRLKVLILLLEGYLYHLKGLLPAEEVLKNIQQALLKEETKSMRSNLGILDITTPEQAPILSSYIHQTITLTQPKNDIEAPLLPSASLAPQEISLPSVAEEKESMVEPINEDEINTQLALKKNSTAEEIFLTPATPESGIPSLDETVEENVINPTVKGEELENPALGLSLPTCVSPGSKGIASGDANIPLFGETVLKKEDPKKDLITLRDLLRHSMESYYLNKKQSIDFTKSGALQNRLVKNWKGGLDLTSYNEVQDLKRILRNITKTFPQDFKFGLETHDGAIRVYGCRINRP